MFYKFFNYYFDVDKKELYFQQEKIHLTQQNFKLLKVFLENSHKVITKDQLIKEVWNGRFVEDNTIDQAFSKLRKILNANYPSEYFEVGYGKGWKLLPKVKQVNATKDHSKPFIVLIGIIVALLVLYYFWGQKDKSINKTMFMFVPQEVEETSQWWSTGTSEIIGNFLGHSHHALIKEYQAKEKDMVKDEYLQYLWDLSPDLNVISATIEQEKDSDLYLLKVNIKNPSKQSETKTFKHKQINQLFKQTSQWFTATYGIQIEAKNILPDNDLATELFLQGIKNLKIEDFEKSENYFKLSVQESPRFNLARIKLAEVYKKTNQLDQALVQLETIQISDEEINEQLNVIGLKGDIYEIQGKHQLAKELYESALNQYMHDSKINVNEIRFYLSDVYFSLTENLKAIEQLNLIEENINAELFPYLLADTHRQQGQIYFINGDFDSGVSYTQKALKLYTDLGYIAGQIKAFASLSRFFQHQNKYDEAIGYINKSLALSRVKENPMLIGATINQLIYLLNTQGLMSQAWTMTEEMEKIGLEIGFTRMVIAAKHHFAELARHQEKFLQAKANLDEHLKLAKQTDNKRAIHTNNLLMLDYLLDQNLTEGVQDLIEKVQKHIDETNEIRLQPVINLQQARLNTLLNQTDNIVELLTNSLQQARETEDGETIVMINNFLAEYYLNISDSEMALKHLDLNKPFYPSPKPYLLIRARILQHNGEYSKALELANQCKIESKEKWFVKDQQFLDELRNHMK